MTAIVLQGDARHLPLQDASVDLIVTSPPYFGLRSYTDGGQHYDGQIGSEATPQEWVTALIECTADWMRVLKPSGSIFVNLGDKYAGSQPGSYRRDTQPLNDHGKLGVRAHPSLPLTAKNQREAKPVGWGTTREKSLLGLPWRYALACTDQLGLILRRDIIWAKPNGLPESVTDRCRSSHEYLFHFTVQPRYYAAVDEIREDYSDAADAVHHRRKGIAQNSHHPSQNHNSSIRDYAQTGRRPAYENPLGKLPGSVWSIPSQPLTVPPRLGVDHFAAFPMELPRRCILGWSPPGICTACGAGRRPTVESGRNGDGSKPHKAAMRVSSFSWAKWQEGEPHRITGYACACATPDAPTRPATVLDPFGGTGTTALVASMHGRTGITIDRSADYTRLATWRTHDPAERAKALQVPKPPPVPDGMEPLF